MVVAVNDNNTTAPFMGLPHFGVTQSSLIIHEPGAHAHCRACMPPNRKVVLLL